MAGTFSLLRHLQLTKTKTTLHYLLLGNQPATVARMVLGFHCVYYHAPFMNESIMDGVNILSSKVDEVN